MAKTSPILLHPEETSHQSYFPADAAWDFFLVGEKILRLRGLGVFLSLLKKEKCWQGSPKD